MSFIYNNEIQYADTNVVDAYRKLRVSNQYGIFNSSLQNDIAPEDWETVTAGSASVAYVAVESCVNLNVGTGNGDRCLRQSLETFQYQAGTGMDVLMTGVLGNTQTGTSSRLGIFDDFNGIFWEVKDGALGIVLRRTLSVGVTEDIRIEQADFSNDTIDGNGPSKFNIDITKAQLFNIDYAWLGVGRVRVSVWTGTCFCVVHEFKYNNILSTVYMGKGDLPIRYELVNTAATAGSSTMKQICSSVFLEGGLNAKGYLRSAFTAPKTLYTIPNTNSFYSLLTVRIKSGLERVNLQPSSFDVVVNGSDVLHAFVIQDATFGSALSYIDADDYVEYSRTNTTITGGTRLKTVTVTQGSSSFIDVDIIRDRVYTKYDGSSQTLTLGVSRIDGGADVAGAINFIVYR